MLATICKDDLTYYKRLYSLRQGKGDPAVVRTLSEAEYEELYVQYLKDIVIPEGAESGDPRYELVYLDDDDVPELLYALGASHPYSVYVCIYVNGSVRPLYGDGNYSGNDNGRFICGSFGAVDYYPGTGLLLSEYGGMGLDWKWLFAYDKGEVHTLCSTVEGEAATNDGPQPVSGGYIGETEVSFEEAEQYMNALLESKERKTFDWYDTGKPLDN